MPNVAELVDSIRADLPGFKVKVIYARDLATGYEVGRMGADKVAPHEAVPRRVK